MTWKRILRSRILEVGLAFLVLNALSISCSQFGLKIKEVQGSSSFSDSWFYGEWQYRKEHNITGYQAVDSVRFYDVSNSWTTILENPSQRHAFQPVHNTTIEEANKVVDGATWKYFAYDSDSDGSEIRLYYTNNTDSFWTPYSANPILESTQSHYRWPSVAYVNGTFHMFLTDRTDGTLERWTSTDGIRYTFKENVKTGGNQWKNPFIWFNPNDKKWYLYSHDSLGSTEYFKVRNATGIQDLGTSPDIIVVSRNNAFGSPTLMYFDNKYWLLGETLDNNVWKVVAYCSAVSPSSGFIECDNSPILSNDAACPIVLLTPNETRAYLFTTREQSNWYEETREVYINKSPSIKLDLADYQVRVTTLYGNGTDTGENVCLNGHSRADFGDIRFTWLNFSSKSEVECKYWIEKFTTGTSAQFWIKIPKISSEANNTIYVYYGKNDATTTSNGNDTFVFFDDFNGSLNRWAAVGGTWQIENGELSATTTAFGQRIRANSFSFGNNSVHVSIKWISGTYFENGPYVRGQPPNEQSNGYTTFLSAWSYDSRDRIAKMLSGSETTLAGQGTANPSKSIWYSFVFKLYKNTLKSGISPLYPSEIITTDYSFSNGTLCLFSWSSSSEHVHYDDLFVCKYVDPEPSHGSWGGEEGNSHVVIDQALASDSRADVNSIQVILYHAKWNNNGSDVIGGSIFVNGTEYVTNSTGWINIGTTRASVEKDTWIVTGVNCGGVATYVQTASPQSVIWDRIKITDGGITKDSATLGETVTIWFKAMYEYDQEILSETRGILYVNGSEMLWSALNNRWEYNYIAAALGSEAFVVSGVKDNSYILTAINDAVGPQTLSVWSLPFSIVSNSTMSELAFNSTGKTLSFTVSGPSGTTGCTNITIAKTLVADINELVVYIDENQTSYSVTSTDDSWLLILTYHHSTHRVLVILGSSHAVPLTDAPARKIIIFATAMIIILLATLLFTRRRKRL